MSNTELAEGPTSEIWSFRAGTPILDTGFHVRREFCLVAGRGAGCQEWLATFADRHLDALVPDDYVGTGCTSEKAMGALLASVVRRYLNVLHTAYRGMDVPEWVTIFETMFDLGPAETVTEMVSRKPPLGADENGRFTGQEVIGVGFDSFGEPEPAV